MNRNDKNALFKEKQQLNKVFTVFYAVCILIVTVFGRDKNLMRQYEIVPFWSYSLWLQGNNKIGLQIIKNVFLFIPFGCLAAGSFKRHNFKWPIIGSVVFSVTIELIQFYFCLGTAEFDDVLNNTIGTILGCLIYQCYNTKILKNKRIVYILLTGGCLIAGIVACLLTNRFGTTLERQFAFQVERVDKSSISGYCFLYDRTSEGIQYEIVLQEKSGRKIELKTQSGKERHDVNDYYGGGSYDYTFSGFTAELENVNLNQGYEILVRWDNGDFRTGSYLNSGKVQYAEDNLVELDTKDTDLEEIVTSGVLRLSRPDKHCYVYQYEGYLYWIADNGFDFDREDGLTFVQFQVWTTRNELLPKKRTTNGFIWDNRGFSFETNEITDKIDCGSYRVSRTAIPTEYPIKAVLTGYYNGLWKWKNYFRINKILSSGGTVE